MDGVPPRGRMRARVTPSPVSPGFPRDLGAGTPRSRQHGTVARTHVGRFPPGNVGAGGEGTVQPISPAHPACAMDDPFPHPVIHHSLRRCLAKPR